MDQKIPSREVSGNPWLIRTINPHSGRYTLDPTVEAATYVLGKMPDSEAAQILGVSVGRVNTWRRGLGIGAFGHIRRVQRAKSSS